MFLIISPPRSIHRYIAEWVHSKSKNRSRSFTTPGDHTTIAVVVSSRDKINSIIKRSLCIRLKNVYLAIVTEIAK